MKVVRPETTPSKRFALALSAAQVSTYIKFGRQGIEGSAYDPYAKAKNPTQTMMKDAMTIASWYNSMRPKWSVEQRVNAFRMIREIQHGPQRWWRTVLQQGLTPTEFKAAESWAMRHASGHFVDVNLAPGTRAAIAAVLRNRARLHYEKTAMLDLLRFAFHGLPSSRTDSALDL